MKTARTRETAVTKILMFGISALTILMIAGCEKEKIVTSTEYIEHVEYIESPPDTIIMVDTLPIGDTVIVHVSDTVIWYDTIVRTVHDTTIVIEQHYDTITITDTIATSQSLPNEHLAFSALQYYSDPLVISFINLEFGYNDGWVLYLSEFQVNLNGQSSSVYDIYGCIDYWTPDWSAYYPMEFWWRLSYTGGDPADMQNWRMSEPPPAASGRPPGLKLIEDTRQALPARR